MKINRWLYLLIALITLSLLIAHQGWPDLSALAQGTTITTRVSVASDGSQADERSRAHTISADGRFVAFQSVDSNLVPDDTNNRIDTFVHDRKTGETTLVSIASDGSPQSGGEPAISADGRYIAFVSSTNIFVHDREAGETSKAIDSDESQVTYSSYPAISANGRYVVFYSWDSSLVLLGIFVHDRETGETRRVSIASDVSQSIVSSDNLTISANGRYVVFHSWDSNLVPNDTNGTWDTFVHDRETGETRRVSIASDGSQGNASSREPAISADGRFVAFESWASNLVPNDTNGIGDIFVHDRETGETRRVSIAADGSQGNASSREPVISADGRHIAFESWASNLVPNDTNGIGDIFVRGHTTLPDGSATIKGMVTDEVGKPLPDILVQVYQFGVTWQPVSQVTTSGYGEYTVSNLPTGTYRVLFADLKGVYKTQYYNASTTLADAEDIFLDYASTTDGINAVMAKIPPPPFRVESGCGQVNIASSGDVFLRFPTLCSSPTELAATVVCQDESAPTGEVTFYLNDTPFPMTAIDDTNFKVALNIPDDLPASPIAIRIAAQCKAALETPFEGEVALELYDPSGFITDAKTTQPITGAVVNLYRVPDATPDSGTEQNGDCRTVDTRPSGSSGTFGAWSDVPQATADATHWIEPNALLKTSVAISPTLNPQITGPDGYYGWDVSEGCWYIVVQAEGYQPLVSPMVGVPPEVTDLNLALFDIVDVEYMPVIFK